MSSMLKLAAIIAMAPAVAMAEHHHHGMVTGEAEPSSFAAGLSLVAAQFDTMEYGGEYQGLVPSMRWSHDRFAVMANLGVYRLQKNGLELYGAGDAMVHGQARLVGDGRVNAGLALAVSAPTGDNLQGLGMGHPMVMPAAFGHWGRGMVSVDGSVGYGRAIGGESHHTHGVWPLIEPMNMQEVTFAASGDVVLAKQLRAGGRVSGAMPIGDGISRVIGGVRVLWTEGRVDTAFEVQAGIAGDPFTLRGVLETALRF